jgi:hypothetical protein
MPSNDVEVKTYIEKIDKLIANPDNPRQIRDDAFKKLKRSLQEFPQMKQLREVVVDENLMILGGHQRIYALKELGYEDVTIKQVTGLTDKQKREFVIKDNASSGEWDKDMIANNWDVKELENWGIKSFDISAPKDLPDDDTPLAKEVICPNCQHEFIP